MRAHAAQQPRSTSSASVLSPQISRCRPSSQRSPGRLTGSTGASGTSSSPRARRPRRRRRRAAASSSSSPKPTSRRSKSSASSSRSSPREQLLVPAAELGQLVVGDDVGPLLRLGQVGELDHRHLGQAELRAASTRPWPAMSSPSPSTSTGLVQPNCGSRRRSAPPARRRGSGRSAHRASAARAATSRWLGAKLRVMSDHPGRGRSRFRGWTSAARFHWAAVDSFRVQRKPPPEGSKSLFYWPISGEPVDCGCRVASQKFAAVASELAR